MLIYSILICQRLGLIACKVWRSRGKFSISKKSIYGLGARRNHRDSLI